MKHNIDSMNVYRVLNAAFNHKRTKSKESLDALTNFLVVEFTTEELSECMLMVTNSSTVRRRVKLNTMLAAISQKTKASIIGKAIRASTDADGRSSSPST